MGESEIGLIAAQSIGPDCNRALPSGSKKKAGLKTCFFVG
jgi:hypothetical protein